MVQGVQEIPTSLVCECFPRLIEPTEVTYFYLSLSRSLSLRGRGKAGGSRAAAETSGTA